MLQAALCFLCVSAQLVWSEELQDKRYEKRGVESGLHSGYGGDVGGG